MNSCGNSMRRCCSFGSKQSGGLVDGPKWICGRREVLISLSLSRRRRLEEGENLAAK